MHGSWEHHASERLIRCGEQRQRSNPAPWGRTMDQQEIRVSALNQEEVQERIKLVSFEVYQAIMDQYVGSIMEQAKPIASKAIADIENQFGELMDLMDRETLIGTVAVGIWAEISAHLANQIYQQYVDEPTVLQ